MLVARRRRHGPPHVSHYTFIKAARRIRNLPITLEHQPVVPLLLQFSHLKIRLALGWRIYRRKFAQKNRRLAWLWRRLLLSHLVTLLTFIAHIVELRAKAGRIGTLLGFEKLFCEFGKRVCVGWPWLFKDLFALEVFSAKIATEGLTLLSHLCQLSLCLFLRHLWKLLFWLLLPDLLR